MQPVKKHSTKRERPLKSPTERVLRDRDRYTQDTMNTASNPSVAITGHRDRDQPPQVTLRGTIVGLGIGTLILLSNFQFGLQTGWVSMMSLPAALLAFSIFKVTESSFFRLSYPFSPQENVYVQSVAVAVATGPLAYGFIGIVPAIEKLLTPEESGLVQDMQLQLSETFDVFKPWWKLLIWSSGLAFFGVFFAIPLREEFIIRQQLKFPSGSATATLISVFHRFPLRIIPGIERNKNINDRSISSSSNSNNTENGNAVVETLDKLTREDRQLEREIVDEFDSNNVETLQNSPVENSQLYLESPIRESYSRDITLLLFTALFSSAYTLTSYFVPQIRTIPIFGTYLSEEYLINFTPSPAYVGQGIIMGFDTTCGMMVGMVLGWCILSPFVKYMGWAPGETGSWKDGAEGWIMWVSLAIMIADSLVSLGLMAYKSTKSFFTSRRNSFLHSKLLSNPGESSHLLNSSSSLQQTLHSENDEEYSNENGGHRLDSESYSSVESASNSTQPSNIIRNGLAFFNKEVSLETDNEESIHPLTPTIGLLLCCPLLVFSMKIVFKGIIPSWLLLLTIPVSLILSLVGVKSLGETDLNPVSGIGKLSQLLTASVVPSSRPGAVLINLVVGAVSEATAQQAGDLMQDLKTGYLLHGSPQAQFIAQIFGSIWGVLVAAPMYRWYDRIYQIPGPLFKIPTAFIWIDCARLVNGHELPEKVGSFVIAFGVLFLILSFIRGTIDKDNKYYKFSRWVPSGVAVGIGIYNTPSFTFARFLGGLISWYWLKRLRGSTYAIANPTVFEDGKVSLIIFSSGLVLGEGLFSVVNMMLTSFGVPHL